MGAKKNEKRFAPKNDLSEKRFDLKMENRPSACISDAKPLEFSECGNISILNCACFSGVLYVNTHTTFCVNCHGETHQLKQEYRGSDIPKMVCINSGAVYCQFCNSCKQNTCV